MTNIELAWRIHDGLKQAGIDIGEDSIEMVKLLIDDAEAERWIPVSERLPEKQADVLALAEATGSYYVAHQRYDVWYKTDGYFVNRPVTHWQPLPEAPEADNG